MSTEVANTPTSTSISLDAGLDKTRRLKMTTSTNYALGPDNKFSADISFEIPSEVIKGQLPENFLSIRLLL